MSACEQFDRAAAEVQRVVDAVDEAGLTLPSPCSEWDVRAVVNHMVTGNLMFAAIMRGEPLPDQTADYLGARPAEAFARSVSAFREASAQPGVLERGYPTPIGERPGEFMVHMRVNEIVVHGWDVAAATGQSTDLVADLAQQALRMWRTRLAGQPRPQDGPFGPSGQRPAMPPRPTGWPRSSAGGHRSARASMLRV